MAGKRRRDKRRSVQDAVDVRMFSLTPTEAFVYQWLGDWILCFDGLSIFLYLDSL